MKNILQVDVSRGLQIRNKIGHKLTPKKIHLPQTDTTTRLTKKNPY